jgi:hypothetical protein
VFGMIRPCRHTLTPALRDEWVGHLCGLCLALRDGHGQLARVATNYDGLLISVLVDAQTDHRASRVAGRCPLRGMRKATVATGEGARLAAVVSLVLASASLADHAADGDGALAHRGLARAADRLSGRWSRHAAVDGARLGLDSGVLLDAIARQPAAERSATSLLAVTEPTEDATAAAFAHTAVLSGRPDNAAALAEAGRLFGRLAHLLDAVEDQRDDVASGAWNPLVATGTDLATARRHADDAVLGVKLALGDVEWTNKALAHRLLVHELGRAVDHAFAHAGHVTGEKVDFTKHPVDPEPPRGRGLLAGCAAAVGLFCTCQVCCADEYPGPWSGKPRQGWCSSVDCCDCDGCDCDGCDCCCDCDCCDCNC